VVQRFFSLRIPIFGTVAIAFLCLVLFLVPFALRGARMGMMDMQNNVADWLPPEYAETQDLGEFRKHFYGDQFVVVSGPWCNEGDPNFAKFRDAIRRESLEYEQDLKAAGLDEELRAHRKGDELGLLFTGNYHQTWGENNEKWLQGREGKWYFINRRGDLFRWEGQNNVVEGIKRFLERITNGTNKAQGTYIGTFGAPTDDGSENPFYQNPEKLCCRPFKSVISGPEAFLQMAGPEGTLRIRKSANEDELSAFEAEMEAHKVLTGAMFGPTPPRGFNWTFESLLQHVDKRMQAKLNSDPNYRSVFNGFMEAETRQSYGGELEQLIAADQKTQLETWYRLWHQLELPAPPRQTCLIVTLNEPIIEELARAIGRPLMGKPRGRLPEIGISICGIESNNLHMGGPPCDNVAIDEEGTNTLIRLAGLSFVIGMTLAYFSFGRVRVALMIFFVGGISAISSLAIVWYGGSSMDAILMTMPSLVYVLGLSASVHFVNYYRDACHEFGPRRAAEVAVKQSWFPVLLASVTTAMGLISLTTSTLNPIYKFGLFSAIAVVLTVGLMYAYLPSALTFWRPGYRRQTRNTVIQPSGFSALLHSVSNRIGNWIIRHYQLVGLSLVGLMLALAVGLKDINTTVQLLKLFDADAKILKDYRWLEENLGELVPAEIVICVDRQMQREPYTEQVRSKAIETAKKSGLGNTPEVLEALEIKYDAYELDRRYSMLERLELSSRVRQQLEKFFGPNGLRVVGSGTSTDVFTPLYKLQSKSDPLWRFNFSAALYAKKQAMVEQDYLAVVGESAQAKETSDPQALGREMWRISIRLAALNNVDYGRFVNDLKQVVEPIMNAYQYRTRILEAIHSQIQQRSESEQDNPIRILVLGPDPTFRKPTIVKPQAAVSDAVNFVDQTFIFAETLQDLLENREFERNSKARRVLWIDPKKNGVDVPDLTDAERRNRKAFFSEAQFGEFVSSKFDCVVLIEDDPLFNPDLLASKCKTFVDCRNHRFQINPRNYLPVAGAATARERRQAGESIDVSAIYTGVVPIVYKAQRALLHSLVQSIAMSFVMISFVMMILVRPWNVRPQLNNLINFRGGLLSMVPNVFPILVVFGYMGWAGIEVDIGSMMTASVAMGIAVDDTIHFLTWYREGLNAGLSRHAAIRFSYDKVAIAMIQTTLIAGLGLAAFALSTFTPTQRFGVLMLFLLSSALIGDLLILPAILASPLGKYFGSSQLQTDVSPDGMPTDGILRLSQDTPTAGGQDGPIRLRVVGEPANLSKPDEKPIRGSGG
jgi:predicted RND superfamily exporter protein